MGVLHLYWISFTFSLAPSHVTKFEQETWHLCPCADFARNIEYILVFLLASPTLSFFFGYIWFQYEQYIFICCFLQFTRIWGLRNFILFTLYLNVWLLIEELHGCSSFFFLFSFSKFYKFLMLYLRIVHHSRWMKLANRLAVVVLLFTLVLMPILVMYSPSHITFNCVWLVLYCLLELYTSNVL